MKVILFYSVTFIYSICDTELGEVPFQKSQKNTLTFRRFSLFLPHPMSSSYFYMETEVLYCLFLFWKNFECQISSIIRHYTN
jgi:hypothetical protein